MRLAREVLVAVHAQSSLPSTAPSVENDKACNDYLSPPQKDTLTIHSQRVRQCVPCSLLCSSNKSRSKRLIRITDHGSEVCLLEKHCYECSEAAAERRLGTGDRGRGGGAGPAAGEVRTCVTLPSACSSHTALLTLQVRSSKPYSA